METPILKAVDASDDVQRSSPACRESFRQEMPVVDRWVYLDHAAVGPLTRAASQAISDYVQQVTTSGDVHWPTWAGEVEQTRACAARLIGAEAEEVALVHSTSEGIALVAEGLDWRSGDNVVLPAGEFPSNVYPWLHLRDKGVEVRRVEMPTPALDYQRLADACDAQTRVVSCSWIGYSSGYRCDPSQVADIAHRHGAYFMLDAIQGLGVFPINVRQAGIDFLAADGHKWQLGPEGAGIAYFRRELLEQLRPLIVGWNSVVGRFDFHRIELELRPEAARYEPGSQNMVGQLGLGGSLKTLERYGLSSQTSSIADWVLDSVEGLLPRLANVGVEVHPIPPEYRTGIVTFEVPGMESAAVRAHLLERCIVTSCRGGKVRVAVHGYNDRSDFDRLITALEELT